MCNNLDCIEGREKTVKVLKTFFIAFSIFVAFFISLLLFLAAGWHFHSFLLTVVGKSLADNVVVILFLSFVGSLMAVLTYEEPSEKPKV